MKFKSVIRLFVIILCACLVCVSGRASADTQTQKVKEPDLVAIVDVLKGAKTAEHPDAMLDQTKKLLAKEAKKNAHTRGQLDAKADLDKAATAVGEAKTAFTAGDKQTMTEKIDHASSMVRLAIEAREEKN